MPPIAAPADDATAEVALNKPMLSPRAWGTRDTDIDMVLIAKSGQESWTNAKATKTAKPAQCAPNKLRRPNTPNKHNRTKSPKIMTFAEPYFVVSLLTRRYAKRLAQIPNA